MKKNINIENLGTTVYYIYRFIKFIIFAFNIFVLYRYLNGNPIFIKLSIILNIIYLILYIDRIYLNIGSIIIFYIIYKDIIVSISLGLGLGNAISYVFDFIIIKILSLISYLAQK